MENLPNAQNSSKYLQRIIPSFVCGATLTPTFLHNGSFSCIILKPNLVFSFKVNTWLSAETVHFPFIVEIDLWCPNLVGLSSSQYNTTYPNLKKQTKEER